MSSRRFVLLLWLIALPVLALPLPLFQAPIAAARPPDAPSQVAANLEGIGHIGGISRAVDVQGHYTYLATFSWLVILDSSDPARPFAVGRSATLPRPITELVVEGNYAYAATAGGGFHIFDVSNPAAPVRVGAFKPENGFFWHLTVVDNRAYLIEGDGILRIVDMSNPTAPIEVGSFATPGAANDVEVVGNYAYVVYENGFSGGMVILDVSDPAHPTQVSDTLGGGRNPRIVVAGHHAYVATMGGFRIFDVSNPQAPERKGYFSSFSVQTGALSVVGNYAYLTGLGFYVFDVADASNPTLISSYNEPVHGVNIAVEGNYAYIAAQARGLRVLDVTAPATPVRVGGYDIPASNEGGLALSGNRLYVADGVSGLNVVDVTDPTAPRVEGAFELEEEAHDVTVVGDYAYVSRRSSNTLHILNVSDSAAPVEVAQYHSSGIAYNVTASGNYLYFSTPDGLHILDLEEPAAPQEVGFFARQYIWGFAVAGNHLYLSYSDEPSDSYPGSLIVLDVSTPGTPTVRGRLETERAAQHVAVSGNLVFLGEQFIGSPGSSPLRIINVADPAAPRMVGSYSSIGSVVEIMARDHLVYILSSGSPQGLHILDISNPASPTLVAHSGVYGIDFVVEPPHIYVAGGGIGLHIVRFTPPPSGLHLKLYAPAIWWQG